MSQSTTTPSGVKQWLRKISLIAATPDGKGRELSDLRVKFNITGVLSGTPSTLDATIYNLSKPTAQFLQSLPTIPIGATVGSATPSTVTNAAGKVVLQAGYEGNVGIIFAGQLMQVRCGRESGTDTTVDLFAGDGDWAHNWGFINSTLAAGWKPKDVNEQIKTAYAAYGTVVADMPAEIPQAVGPRGKVVFGMARDYASNMAAWLTSHAFIEKGSLTWLPASAYLSNDTIVLTSATGMIGLPQQTNYGISIRCLLNPSISRGRLIQIDNKSIQQLQFTAGQSPGQASANQVLAGNLDLDGHYKVFAVDHVGDTRGNEWYTEMQCMAVHPVGAPGGPAGARPATIPDQFLQFPVI